MVTQSPATKARSTQSSLRAEFCQRFGGRGLRSRPRGAHVTGRIHNLRHSFASTAVSGGDSLYLLSKVLGHRDVRTTQRYAHLADDPVHAVADRTSEKISSIISGSRATSKVSEMG